MPGSFYREADQTASVLEKTPLSGTLFLAYLVIILYQHLFKVLCVKCMFATTNSFIVLCQASVLEFMQIQFE